MTRRQASKYKPAMSLAGNNALAHYEQSRGYDRISHALSNIHGLYGWSCNLLDVISVYSLNPGKLPGRFCYERPWYEASGQPAQLECALCSRKNHSCMSAHIHFVLLQYIVDWHTIFFLVQMVLEALQYIVDWHTIFFFVQMVLEARRHDPTNFSVL